MISVRLKSLSVCYCRNDHGPHISSKRYPTKLRGEYSSLLEAIHSIAQQLEQKGIEKGIQLGEQRGIEKGRSEDEQQVTLKITRTMLQNGIDRNIVMKMAGLTEDDLAQIRH